MLKNSPIITIAITCFSLLLPTKGQAQTYPPGTTGHLYQQCQETLSSAQNLKEAHNSYCGAFIEGYVMGLLAIQGGNIPKTQENDPCRIDKDRAYNSINNRFCPHFPAFTLDTIEAGQAIDTIYNLITQWAQEHKILLSQPPSQALSSMLSPGPFCDKTVRIMKNINNHVNPALKNITWTELLGAKTLVTMDKKHQQCLSDIEQSDGQSTRFKNTQCAAEITGFISGLRAGENIPNAKTEIINPRCEKPISRLYDSFDISKTMCVRQNTDPLLVAKIFTKNFALIRGDKKLWGWSSLFDAGDLGAVGYETIYRGFLCRNETEAQAARASK